MPAVEAEDGLQAHLHRVRRLHTEPVVETAVGIPRRRRRTGLERARRHPRMGERERHDHVAAVEEPLGIVADRVRLGDVVVEMVEQRRPVGQRVVLDDHEVGGVGGVLRALRDDDRHRLPDVPHDIAVSNGSDSAGSKRGGPGASGPRRGRRRVKTATTPGECNASPVSMLASRA